MLHGTQREAFLSLLVDLCSTSVLLPCPKLPSPT